MKPGDVVVAGSAATLLVGAAGVDGVTDNSGGKRTVGVEDDGGLGVDDRACGVAGFGLNSVDDEALAQRRAGVGRQEALELVVAGGPILGRRVNAGERDGQQASLHVEVGVDVDQDADAGGGIDLGAVGAQAGRHVDGEVAEADDAELERAQVELGGVELLGDGDHLGRCGRGRLVGECDLVGEGLVGRHKALSAESGGAGDVVGVDGLCNTINEAAKRPCGRP